MATAFSNTFSFLIQAVFNIYMIALLIRILLEATGANYYNPIIQFLLRITDPLIKPLAKWLKCYKGVNLAGVVILFVVGIIKLSILVWLRVNTLGNPTGLIIWTLGEVINLLINVYFYAILIRAILSWVAPQTHNPAVELLVRLTNPVLRPFQRFIPLIANVDLSPLVAMICLQAFAILFVQFITSYGVTLSIGNALA